MAALLFMGSWLVGVRAVSALVHQVPKLRWALRSSQAAGEPATFYWILLILTLAACVLAGLALLASLLGVLMVEGSQVLVDDLGIAVEHGAMPRPLAHRMGAGRLTWKQVAAVKREGPCFVIRGGGDPKSGTSRPEPNLRFLMVEDLERLILLVLERSPHVRFDD